MLAQGLEKCSKILSQKRFYISKEIIEHYTIHCNSDITKEQSINCR